MIILISFRPNPGGISSADSEWADSWLADWLRCSGLLERGRQCERSSQKENIRMDGERKAQARSAVAAREGRSTLPYKGINRGSRS